MKLTIPQILENSFVITIDEMQERFFRIVMRKVGFDSSMIKTFKGRTDSDSRKLNCTNSHLDIIKYARDNNLPYVTIFEDDCFPANIFNMNDFETYINSIPEIAVGLVYGYTNNRDFQNANICTLCKNIKGGNVNGSHFYTVFRSGYDQIITRLETKAASDVAINVSNMLYPVNNFFVQCALKPQTRMAKFSADIINKAYKNAEWHNQFFDKKLYDEALIEFNPN